MLAVLGAGGARLDAGAVAVALARCYSGAGREVLLVDADPFGAQLAERLGEAVGADFAPTVRGLPSLVVARKPLTLRLLADHCYSVDGGGLLWALFAPTSAAGGRFAARWLGERADDLAAVHRERTVVVSASLDGEADSLELLLGAAAVLLVVAEVEHDGQAEMLRARIGRAAPDGASRDRLLAVAGHSPFDDGEIEALTGLEVAARLPLLSDEQVLRGQRGRRERHFFATLDELADVAAARLSLNSSVPAAAPGTAAARGEDAASGAAAEALRGGVARLAAGQVA